MTSVIQYSDKLTDWRPRLTGPVNDVTMTSPLFNPCVDQYETVSDIVL